MVTSEPCRASSTRVTAVYNFCEDFTIEVRGRRIVAATCYRISMSANGPVFRIGYIKNGQYREIEADAKDVRFDRRIFA